jgi:hypothetical protein
MANTVTTASTDEVFHGEFECRHCELQTTALVLASGRGQAEGHADDGAGHAAYKDAEDDANNVAARTLQFVKCPRCGKRDPAGRSYRIQMTIGAVLAGAVLGGITTVLGIIQNRGRGAEVLLPIFLIVSGVLGAIFYFRFRRPWAGADARTKFDGDFVSLPRN